MKKLLIASALVFASVGTASANIVIPGVSSTDLDVRIDNGVATLFGNVDSGVEEAMAKNYVAGLDGVDRVIDLVTHSTTRLHYLVVFI